MGCSRFILFVLNISFFVFGGALLTIGLFSEFDPNFHSLWAQFGDNGLINASTLNKISFILIIIGGTTFLLGFIGCVGAVKQSRVLLSIYLIILILLLTVKVVAIYYVISFNSQFVNEFKGVMDLTVKNANDGDELSQQTMFALQKSFKCCGSTGPNDYNDNKELLESCYENGKSDELFYTTGCTKAVITYVNARLPVVNLILFILILVEIFTIIFTLCACNKGEDYEFF